MADLLEQKKARLAGFEEAATNAADTAKTQATIDPALSKSFADLALSYDNQANKLRTEIENLESSLGATTLGNRGFMKGILDAFTYIGSSKTSEWGSITGHEYNFNIIALLLGMDNGYNNANELNDARYRRYIEFPKLHRPLRDQDMVNYMFRIAPNSTSNYYNYAPWAFAVVPIKNTSASDVTISLKQEVTAEGSYSGGVISAFEPDNATNALVTDYTFSALGNYQINGQSSISVNYTFPAGKTVVLVYQAGSLYRSETNSGYHQVIEQDIYNQDLLFGGDENGLSLDVQVMKNLMEKDYRLNEFTQMWTHSQE